MADDKSKMGGPDRSRIAGGEEYEVRHFAEKHGISMQDAKALIEAHGNNRAKLDEAARQISTRGERS